MTTLLLVLIIVAFLAGYFIGKAQYREKP